MFKMTISFPFKDPDEVLDYTLDWSARITTDPIFSSTWLTPSPAGLTIATASFASFTTLVWLEDGTLGSTYQLTNRIVTVGGRTMDQTCKIKIRGK